MPYSDPDKQRQAKRESARRVRAAASAPPGPDELRRDAAAGCFIAWLTLKHRYGIEVERPR